MATARPFRSAPPLRGELFTDPRAEVVWLAIGGLAERGKHEIRDRLIAEAPVPEVRRSDEQVRQARAVAALREAQEMATLEAGGALLSLSTSAEICQT